MSEAEAQAIRFTIDHYEPQTSRPDLVDTYANLMWACDECNTRKGNRCPPDVARADGFRFYKADEDTYLDHFKRNDLLLEARTSAAVYTIEAVDLNRLTLRRLRGLRQRLYDCEEAVTAGIVALKDFPIDRLPANLRASVASTATRISEAQDATVSAIDDLLRDRAKSPFLDAGDEEPTLDRKQRLKDIEAMYPGEVWRRSKKARP